MHVCLPRHVDELKTVYDSDKRTVKPASGRKKSSQNRYQKVMEVNNALSIQNFCVRLKTFLMTMGKNQASFLGLFQQASKEQLSLVHQTL